MQWEFLTRCIHPPKWVAVGHAAAFACTDRYTAGQRATPGYQKGRLNAGEVLKQHVRTRLFCHRRIVFRVQLELFVSKRTVNFQRCILDQISFGVFKLHAAPLVDLEFLPQLPRYRV